MSTGGDSSEAEASLNVHVALECTRCCTNVHVSLESLSVLKVHLAPSLLFLCAMEVYTLCNFSPYTMNTQDNKIYFRLLCLMLHSVSKLSHNQQGSIDLWTANIHQNVGFYFLILPVHKQTL